MIASPSMSPQRLVALRHRIDEIDTQILTLLLARSEVVSDISVEKERLSLPIADPARESTHLGSLLEAARAQGASTRAQALVASTFESIFKASRTFQER